MDLVEILCEGAYYDSKHIRQIYLVGIAALQMESECAFSEITILGNFQLLLWMDSAYFLPEDVWTL